MEDIDFEKLYPQGLLCGLDSVPKGVGVVYLITNLINGKVYVGQTWAGVAKRWASHRADCRTRCQVYFHSALKKHGKHNFSVGILGWAKKQEELDNLETLWIVLLNSTDPTCGYNLTYGGGNGKHNADFREKQSSRMREAWDDAEFRSKMIESHEGMRKHPDFKERQSAGSARYWNSPEGKKQRSDIITALWQDAGYRENMTRIFQDPLVLDKKRKKSTDNWADPEIRAKRMNSIGSPENRRKISEAAKRRVAKAGEEGARIMSERTKNLWKDPEYREKQLRTRRAQAADPAFEASRVSKMNATRKRNQQPEVVV